MRIIQTVPVLRIFDVGKPGLPLYMQISRDGCVLHLSEHHGDGSPGATVFLRVTGVLDFHAELEKKNYRYQRPGVALAPWNARLMELTDPFGNRLRFNEDLK